MENDTWKEWNPSTQATTDCRRYQAITLLDTNSTLQECQALAPVLLSETWHLTQGGSHMAGMNSNF